MKGIATGLFLFAAVVFLACVLLGEEAGAWVGYVRATAEASMVGALADWFAVTALFRHPLGVPIPHTAIIPRKKDQIGASLGTFVQENFLTRAVVEERLDGVDVPGRLGAFLAAPGRAERLADDAGAALGALGDLIADDEVQQTVSAFVDRKLRETPAAPGSRGCWSWPSTATGTRRCCRPGCPASRSSSPTTGWSSAPGWATHRPRGCRTGSTTRCSTGSSSCCAASWPRSAPTRSTRSARCTTAACGPTCTSCAPIRTPPPGWSSSRPRCSTTRRSAPGPGRCGPRRRSPS